MKPLAKQMKPEDHERVFYKISVIYTNKFQLFLNIAFMFQELHDIHSSFFFELSKFRNPNAKISATFMKWREKFLVYGGYCANLTKATSLLQELCDSDENFKTVVVVSILIYRLELFTL